MKIAVIAPPWIPVPPPAYGGIEAVVALLVEHLIRLGHEVVLFCAPGSRSKAKMVHPLNHAYEGKIGNSLPETDHVLQALEYVRDSGDFDVIHDHTNIAVALAKYCDIRMVHTMHNGHGLPDNLDRAAFYCRHASAAHLVAISEAQKKTAPATLNVAGVVPNPIDATEWPYMTRKMDFALWVGRFDPIKGAHEAIRACKIAGMRLIMAGPVQPGQEQYFATQIQPHIDDDKIKYVGSVGGMRKKSLFAAASALVMPIRWNEPFGMVLVEALVSGTPVIAYPWGAATEIVIDGVNGYQVEDASAMAEALGALGDINSEQCRESVTTRYDPERIARAYVDLYKHD